MRRTIIITAVLCFVALQLVAQETVLGVKTKDLKVVREGDNMSVDMKLDLSDLNLKGKRAAILTPCIERNNSSVNLKSIGIYSRGRYYHYIRKNGEGMLTDGNEVSYKKRNTPDVIDYHDEVPYEAWMADAVVKLQREDYGCCGTILDSQYAVLGSCFGLPELIYARPELDAVRALKGTAHIDFPVDKSTILLDFNDNKEELAQIKQSISSIIDNPDLEITSVELKGYASPESPFSHNDELAIARTEALKDFLMKQYGLTDDVIKVDHEAEDWADLRKCVEGTSLEYRDSILAIIDTNMDLDKKEAQIKAKYPKEYTFLLDNCYPALRHTDYHVTYASLHGDDIDAIKEAIATNPDSVGQYEMYLVARTLEPGSKDYDALYQTMARVYPDNEDASLNAANAAIKSGDLKTAQSLLEKAGDTDLTNYAKGVTSYLNGDITQAKSYLEKSASMGLSGASDLLNKLK